MASNTCLRRIAGTPQAIHAPFTIRNLALRPSSAAPFSTSAALLAAPKKGGPAPTAKKGKSLRLKRGKAPKSDGKPPAPGERKAMRKRIVLSNTNALEVPGMEDISAENLQKEETWGKVMGLSGEVVDHLRTLEAFKPRQGWFYFRRPATLMRKETRQLAKLMDDASAGKTTTRTILAGDRFTGKSTLLLQGMTMAILKGWVVVSLPDGMEIVNAHTAYRPLEGSNPVQYVQPQYIAKILNQTSKANRDVLSKIRLSPNHGLPIRASGREPTLVDLCEFGARNHDHVWAAYNTLFKELSLPGRPPVFYAIDGLAHIMTESAYNAPDMKKIHAHDLLIANHFVSYLSGKQTLPNGGLIVGATSASNQPASAALDFAAKCGEMRAAGVPKEQIPPRDPFKKLDERAWESLKSVDALKVDGLNKQEARSIMEYYAASGLMRTVINEPLVSERWTLAGSGNIGELERGSLRMRI